MGGMLECCRRCCGVFLAQRAAWVGKDQRCVRPEVIACVCATCIKGMYVGCCTERKHFGMYARSLRHARIVRWIPSQTDVLTGARLMKADSTSGVNLAVQAWRC